jgi:hypothetical protein
MGLKKSGGRWYFLFLLRKCSFFMTIYYIFIFPLQISNSYLNNSQIGQYISSNGGVVTAEELAPFLDVPPPSEESKAWELLP